VSSCTFGGPNLDELFVTTASYQMSAIELAAAPLSGSIFRCRPGAVGRPVRRYAG
jgi:sugar lactone lactonase YvrE